MRFGELRVSQPFVAHRFQNPIHFKLHCDPISKLGKALLVFDQNRLLPDLAAQRDLARDHHKRLFDVLAQLRQAAKIFFGQNADPPPPAVRLIAAHEVQPLRARQPPQLGQRFVY
jgi:hypothetical protein